MGKTDEPKKITPVVQECTEACSSCCGADEKARLMEIQGEIAMRNRALTQSTILVVLLFATEVAFSYIQRPLTLPNIEIIWMIICAPWFGAAGSKVAESVVMKVIERRGQ